MFLDVLEFLKPKDDLNNRHIGIVVKNEDPLFLNRFKVTIHGLIEDSTNSYEKLPWVTFSAPENSIIKPPEIGAKVFIRFFNKDIYFPYFDGFVIDKTNSIAIQDNGFEQQFSNNYPNVYGFDDKKGNYEITNNSTEHFYERKFKSGVKVKINKDGNLTETNYKNIDISFTGKYELKGNDINFGNMSKVKKVVLEDHLTKFDRLANLFKAFIDGEDAMWTALAISVPVLAPISGAFTTLKQTIELGFNTPTPIPENGENLSSETKLS